MLRLLQVAGVAFSKLQNADNVGKSPALILKRGFMIAIMDQSSHGSPAAEQARMSAGIAMLLSHSQLLLKRLTL